MEFDSFIDLYLGVLWVLGSLIFATFLIEFAKDMLVGRIAPRLASAAGRP